MKTVHIVMPCFNEAEGIQEFIDEIYKELESIDFEITVIDDASQDKTAHTLSLLEKKYNTFHYFVNTKNMGHGMSTILAMNKGIESGSEIICTVDGDGQFLGKDIAIVISALRNEHYDVIEGCRVSRNEALFRRIVTRTVKWLVYLTVGAPPTDANTPLRAYRRDTLSMMLVKIPKETLIPNLFISALSRRLKVQIKEIDVTSLPRRGQEVLGSTWNQKTKLLPSRRFIRFCINASVEWIKFSTRMSRY